jgi:hypothetical protein
VSGLSGTVTYPSSTISDSGGDVTASTTTSYGFNQGSSPFGEPNWLSLTPLQNITFTFAHPVDYVGFFWGSVDNSDWVYLYDGATLLGSYEGLITPPIATGGSGSGYTDFFAGTGEEITSIELLNAGSFTFETDNLSYREGAPVTSTPEPSSFLLLSSLAGLAIMLRRKLGARAVRQGRNERCYSRPAVVRLRAV